MALEPGHTYINCGHLWVVIAILPGTNEMALVANLTSKQDGSDTTLILKNGDHPFLKHDTVMNYIDTRDYGKDDLASRIEKRYFEKREPFSSNILRKIQQGLLDSPNTPKLYKKSCTQIFGKDR